MVNPGTNNSAYATDGEDVTYGNGEIDEEYGGSGEDGFNVSESDANAGISTHAATAGLTIGGDAANKQVTIAPGEVGYREHTVSVDVSDVTAYTLTISGPTNLTGPTGATTIGGAGGKVGSSMSDNTWGYGWGETTAAKESLSYQTLTSSGTNLDVPAVSSYAAKFTKKLAFAAKFGSTNSNTGQYKANVTLSLVATPATTTYAITYNANTISTTVASIPSAQNCVVAGAPGANCTTTLSSTRSTRTGYNFLGWSTNKDAATATYAAGASATISANTTLYAIWQSTWDGTTLTSGFSSITNMQQMTPTICASAKPGDYKDLTDTRDSSKYRVVKFRDERCWMTDNLKIYNRTIYATASDFDSPSSITLPNSTLTDFISANVETYQSYYNTDVATSAGVNTTSYYNWYTATAGAGNSSVISESANASICPKNWTLPTGNMSGEYAKFTAAESIANSADGSTKIQAAPYNFKYTGVVIGDREGFINNPYAYGYWSSSTAWSSSSFAVGFRVSSQVTHVTSSHNLERKYGYSVRCIAKN